MTAPGWMLATLSLITSLVSPAAADPGPDLFPSGVGADLGTTPRTMGVRPFAGDDASGLQTGELDGRGFWRTTPAAGTAYVYLDLDDDFVNHLGGASVVLSVRFHDDGTDALALTYDATGDPAKAAPAVPMTGTGQWRTGTFFLDDAQLTNRLNNADLRLSGTEAITISDVRIGKVGASVDLGATPLEHGIAARAGDESGGLVTGVRDGRGYWQTNSSSPPPGTNFFYLNVADAFRYDTRALVLVSVDYLDEGNGALAMHYDSPGDELIDKFKPSETFTYGDTGTWKTHTFALDDAILTNRSNGSDFRLHTAGSAVPLKVAAVRVAVVAAALQPSEGLLNLITEATRVHRVAREGTRDGQYPAGSKAQLQQAIQAAVTVANDPAATADQLKTTAHQLYDTMRAFQAKAVDTDLTTGRTASAATNPSQAADTLDNDQQTAWTGTGWLQVDLGRQQRIDDVRVSWGTPYSTDYTVQTSTDGTHFTTKTRVGAPGARNQRTPIAETTARYVRVVPAAEAAIRELEVRRKPIPQPSPKLVQPNVVADFDATAYGADRTGRKDATRAIQDALYDCYDAGGGTVWLPPGTYRVTNTLEVHAFCTLRGDRDRTVVQAEVAQGNDGPVLFRIGGSAGVMGLTTYYPGQRANAPVPYNYTFEIPGGAWTGPENYMMATVSDVTLLNSYRGIGISTMPSDEGNAPGSGQVHESSTIRNVRGTVLFEGVRANNGADVGTWENVAFGNDVWSSAPARFRPPARQTLDAWTRQNATAFALGDLEWEQLYKLRAADFKVGIRIVPGQRISFAGSFLDTEIRRTGTALQVDDFDSRWGLVFAGGVLEGADHAVKNDSQGFVKLTGTQVAGTTEGIVHRLGGGTAAYTPITIPAAKRSVLYDVRAPGTVGRMPDQDATVRIQQVLDRAGHDGGGIVYLRAGWYRVKGHLVVPENVELRGASAVPNRDQLGASGGTVLMAYEGRGSTESAAALITLKDRSGVRGLRIFYPENNPAGADGLVGYPYAIRATGDAAYTIDTGMPNAWNGIDAQGNGFTARKVTGAFFDHAITVTGDHTRIEGLLSNGNAVTRVGYAVPGWANERDIFPQVIDKYMRTRAKLVTAGNARDLTVMDAFGYGFHDGLKTTASQVTAFNLGTDNLGTDGYTVNATGGATTATNVLRYNGSTSTGPVKLVNLMAINMLQATISVAATGGGTASIDGNETEPGRYERGSQVTAVATGPGFQGWTRDGQVVSTDSRYSFTVDGDLTLTAVFG